MTLKLGIPSKGRLQADAIAWFAARGVALERTGSEREYAGRVRGVGGVDLVLLSAAEIPGELARGRIHLGITGQDLVRERIPRWEASVTELAPARLRPRRPRRRRARRLDRRRRHGRPRRRRRRLPRPHGHRLRVATKYHHLVRDFFRAHGVADYQLVDSQGATEGTVKNLHRRGDRRHHHHRLDPARQPPQGARRRPDPRERGHPLRARAPPVGRSRDRGSQAFSPPSPSGSGFRGRLGMTDLRKLLSAAARPSGLPVSAGARAGCPLRRVANRMSSMRVEPSASGTMTR
jgi:ATP phosphoribosyltransferase